MAIEFSVPPKYRCDSCLDVHDDSDDALNCCKPSITEFYKCPFCHEEHDGHVDAINCCFDRFENGEEPKLRCTKTIDMFEVQP
jgi:hypothetical protein